MKQEQKPNELEEFLEREIKKLEQESAHSDAKADDSEKSGIIWDAAAAAVELGKAKDINEVAEAVMNSDAFAHLTEEVSRIMKIWKPTQEEKPAEGMLSDFAPDSAITYEYDDRDDGAGDAGAGELEEGPGDPYLFSAVSAGSSVTEDGDGGDIFGGDGGKPPPDDGDVINRGGAARPKAGKRPPAKGGGGDDDDDKAERKAKKKKPKKAAKTETSKP